MNTDKLVFFIIGGITVVVLAFIIIFSINEGKQVQGISAITSFSINDKDKPEISVQSAFSDLGTISVKDEKSAQFRIENKGTRPLSLFKISSSCDCTFGKITIDGAESPEFSMHAKNPWTGNIQPGKSGTLDVIYRPFVMPVKGVVTRDVYVSTNDPKNPRMTFTIKAFVK